MGAYQRRKGSAGEREIANILAGNIGIPVRRTLGQARDGSGEGADIELGRWSLEIKRRKRLDTLYNWLEQANTGKGSSGVIMRADGKEWLVVCRLDDWLRLVRDELAENENRSQRDVA